MSKIYDKSLKYRGSEDSFDMRLRVFEDLCPKAGVDPVDYGRAFSTMLAGEASEFYYQKLAGKDLRY